MLSIIAAMAENYVIGKDNNLVWNLPEDLKRFKEITMTGSKTMIMGRKTFESLPLVLPGRKHIILSTNGEYNFDNDNVIIIHTITKHFNKFRLLIINSFILSLLFLLH
jgi:dihydrofolate reductase